MIINKIKSIYYFLLRRVLPWVRFVAFRVEDILFSGRAAPVINCLGDSHTEVFKSSDMKKLMATARLRVVTVQGATAFGLSNPNSKTNAITIFRRELSYIPAKQMVVLLLGEVDCGFLIWYRANKYGTSESVQMEESLSRYSDLLTHVAKRRFARVAVFSVPPPTIGDGCESGLVANQRKSVSATQLQRMHLTQIYNNELKKIASGFGFEFIDILDELLDSDTGLVRSELKNKDVSNHHLDTSMVAPIYARGLRRFIGVME